MTLSEAVDVQHQLKRRLVEEAEKHDVGVTPIGLQSRLADDMPLADYAELWIVHVEKTGRKRPHVVDTDAYRAEQHILPLLGHLYVGDIGKPELVEWMKRVPSIVKEDGTPYAKETLKSVWRLLCTMLRDAELLIGIKNDAPNNMRFRVDAPAQTKKPALTRSELTAILRELEHESPDVATMPFQLIGGASHDGDALWRSLRSDLGRRRLRQRAAAYAAVASRGQGLPDEDVDEQNRSPVS